jgi:hypothetical protein
MLGARWARTGRARRSELDAAHPGPESVRLSRRRPRASRSSDRAVRAHECRPERPSGLVSHAPGRGPAAEPVMAAPNSAASPSATSAGSPGWDPRTSVIDLLLECTASRSTAGASGADPSAFRPPGTEPPLTSPPTRPPGRFHSIVGFGHDSSIPRCSRAEDYFLSRHGLRRPMPRSCEQGEGRCPGMLDGGRRSIQSRSIVRRGRLLRNPPKGRSLCQPFNNHGSPALSFDRHEVVRTGPRNGESRPAPKPRRYWQVLEATCFPVDVDRSSEQGELVGFIDPACSRLEHSGNLEGSSGSRR